jgi:hypothetical protein
MKTKIQIVKGLQSRAEQSSTEKTGAVALPPIDFERRRANRRLSPDRLLTLLRCESPRFFELAEVVGKWVWVQFTEKQPHEVTALLAELGFHWNNKRQVWQHPCGMYRDIASASDPRRKYRSYFAADAQHA